MKHCEIHEQKEITDKLREECGVFGIYDFSGENVASTIYYGLFALQHRGQESCGIAVSDTKGPKGKVLSHKGMGLVNEVFDSESMEKLAGDIGVGHVRYSTAGGSTRENAQPLVLNYIKGTLAISFIDSRQISAFCFFITFPAIFPCRLLCHLRLSSERILRLTDTASVPLPYPASPTEDPDHDVQNDHMQRSACRSDDADRAS